MTEGFIKLSRALLEWDWRDEPKTAYLYIVMLMLANHEDSLWRGEKLRRGQLLTGRRQLAIACGLTEDEVRTALAHLKKTGHVIVTPRSKYSIITLTRYDEHCSVNIEVERESPAKAPENPQQNPQQSPGSSTGKSPEDAPDSTQANPRQIPGILPGDFPSKAPANPQQTPRTSPARPHIQERKEPKERKEKGVTACAPAPARVEYGGGDLTEQIEHVQRASALIRRYGMTDSDATLESVLEDAERYGFDALEQALKRAGESDRRGGVSVNFYRAILNEKRGPQDGQKPKEPPAIEGRFY